MSPPPPVPLFPNKCGGDAALPCAGPGVRACSREVDDRTSPQSPLEQWLDTRHPTWR